MIQVLTIYLLLPSTGLCFVVCFAGYRQLRTRPLPVDFKMASKRELYRCSQLLNKEGRYWLGKKEGGRHWLAKKRGGSLLAVQFA